MYQFTVGKTTKLNMILVLFLAILQVTFSAVPFRKEQNPLIFEQLEGFLYEIPEYEDPLFLEYETSGKSGTPVLTLLQMPKIVPNAKDYGMASKEKLEYVTVELDNVLARLRKARVKLFDGSKDHLHDDLSKSLESLKKLEYTFRPKTPHYLSSMQKFPFVPKLSITSEILGLISKFKDPMYNVQPYSKKHDSYQTTYKFKSPLAEVPLVAPPIQSEPLTSPDTAEVKDMDLGIRAPVLDDIPTEVASDSTVGNPNVEAQIKVNEEEIATEKPSSGEELNNEKQKIQEKESDKRKTWESSNSL